ncbi:MAG: 16S rRNA (guanine(527)-N(7))-methyltransferase RsmG [Rhizobiaceae bacterium]
MKSYESLVSVAGPVSRETFDQLVAFEERFKRWAAAINLAAPSTLSDVWRRHILDSAQLAGLRPDARQWLDLGSGGGFPGAVLAILMREREGACVTLIESNRKKASFLIAATRAAHAPAKVIADRVEFASAAGNMVPQIITARALAPLPVLLRLAAPWLKAGATGLFHKGRDYRIEVQESIKLWDFDLIEHPSKVDPSGAILEISDFSSRSEA